MFQIGEVVSYGATGLCTIEDVKTMSLSKAGTNKQEYYIMRPLASPTCITYVPTTNEMLTSKIRRIYTAEQIDQMICAARGQTLTWIEDTRRRSDCFGQIMSGGNTDELLKLIGCLYLEKKARSAAGKKISVTDEKMLNAAERIVREEFAYVLQIDQNQVSSYIAEKMK